MHNPGRTLRIAGPLAIITVTFFYLLCNVAYYAAASKSEIVESGRLVAALLFHNVWGKKAERVLSAFVALSALGNVLSVVRNIEFG
jgi:amino acid transporter